MKSKTRKLLEGDISEASEPERRSKSGIYWWVTAVREDGRPVLLGAYNSEEEAETIGYNRLQDYDYKVIQLPTRDRGTASSMIKGKRFHDGASLNNSLKRTVHEY
jgi:hypothetical protein